MHLGLQRDERFRPARLVSVVLAQVGLIARHGSALDRARRVLAAHREVADLMRLDRAQRAQHLELLVADGVGVERHRLIHREKAQKLQHVVLHHVAQCARAVVVAAAPLDADGLGDRDLHVVDDVGVPQPLEDRVGETERQQVLDRLLAEVVVDAEDLRLGKDPADVNVDLPRRGEVMADRLFQDDPRRRGDEVVRAEIGRHRPIKIG